MSLDFSNLLDETFEYMDLPPLELPKLWTPMNDEQEMAIETQADELFYGGAAGGGKTWLLIGLALGYHKRSIIFRREHTQVRGIEDDMTGILGSTRAYYNKKDHLWLGIPGGRSVEFGGVPHEKNVQRYQGRAHDLKSFDEITSFMRQQFIILKSWCRTGIPGQRCRVVATGNPPLDEAGMWVIDYWRPWLDPEYEKPAVAGELRYCIEVKGKDYWLDGPTPVRIDKRIYKPRSRTFIPASVDKNPYYMAAGYDAVLDALPEPLRSKLRYGSFNTKTEDDPWQVFPTEWVVLAQRRWRPEQKDQYPVSGAGLDIAHGGKDDTVLQFLHGTFFDEPIEFSGVSTATGDMLVNRIRPFLPKSVICQVDSVAWGAAGFEALKKDGFKVVPVNVGAASFGRDSSKKMRFANLRAELFWKLREALDPRLSKIEYSLPPSRQLLIELCAMHFKVSGDKIQIEEKSEIRRRLGRSPDHADAVALAFRNRIARSAALNWNGKLSR